MARSRNKTHKLFIIGTAPLLVVNGYCLWRLNKIANSLDLPLLGSLSDGFAQIASIILLNSIVIMLLLATRKK